MVLPASCPHSVVVTMGNCRHKVTVLDIPLGWCVVTNDKCIKAKKICASAICNHAPAGTESYQGPAARKSKSPPFPGSVGRSYE